MREYTTEAKYVISEDETIVTSLQELVQKYPKLVSFVRPKNLEWVNVTAQEFYDEAKGVAKGLIANGVRPGDRVVLLNETRYEWNLINAAIWTIGAVATPIRGSFSSGQIRRIIENSDAIFAFTESREHTDCTKPLLVEKSIENPEDGSQLRRILEVSASATDTVNYGDRDIDGDEVERRIKDIKADDLAAVIYISDTTGRPKGCVFLHSNQLAEVRAVLTSKIGLIARPGNRILAFLPLVHVSIHAVSLVPTISDVTQSHWADIKTVTLEFQRSRPHMVLGVPRVFEKARDSAYTSAKEKGALGQAMSERAEATTIGHSKALDTLAGPSRVLKLRHELYDRLLFSKIHTVMGEAVQYTISGGSVLSSDLGHSFRGLGVPVYEDYGLTESTATVIMNNPSGQIIGTVGRPVGGCSAAIADNGEVLFHGLVVFDRYWKNEETTKKALIDGEWFKAGDLGELIEEGHLKVTGYKRDLIVTTGDKNVAPDPMENRVRTYPLVSQAVVIGDGRPFVSVSVTLDEEALGKRKIEHSVPEHTSICELAVSGAVLCAKIQDATNSINELVSHTEAIKKLHILDSDFTGESGELTPTTKVKRNVVMDNYPRDTEIPYQR